MKKFFKVFLVLTFTFIFGLGITSALEKEVLNGNFVVKKNNIEIFKTPGNTVTVNTNGNSNILIKQNITTPAISDSDSEDSFGKQETDWDTFSTYNAFNLSGIVNPSPATAIFFPSSERGKSVVVKYTNIGKYNGKPIGCFLTITPEAASSDAVYQVDNSLYDGVWVRGDANFKYEFFYMDDTGTKIISLDDAYFTLSSFNNYKVEGWWDFIEEVSFDGNGQNNIQTYYFSSDSTMSTRTSNGRLIFYSTSNDFKDCIDLNASTCLDTNKSKTNSFESAAVTFKIKGDSFSFYRNDGWMNVYTAPISGTSPEKPVKFVKTKEGKRANAAEYNIGDTVVFEVDQKVNTLGVDILSRYSSFSIVDPLPAEVDYKDAKLYDASGNEITSGSVSYNKASHTVIWTASKEFLDTMSLNGEVYTLKLSTVLNSKMKTKAVNGSYSLINDSKAVSNEVEVTTPVIVNVPSTGMGITTYAVAVGVMLLIIGFGTIVYVNVYNKKTQKK
ncbi:MAG: isopeptide-forming domain-containing fimbrial protein [Bacilli bacterium]|nr:isopeptide-forming domain-containing fimbrial protein [Bacilli bacterium]